MICQECCQLKTLNVKCYCEDGVISTKHVGYVDGCVIFDNGIRCKKITTNNCVCLGHNNKHTDEDLGYLKKLFN
jgi:hypothetical protein